MTTCDACGAQQNPGTQFCSSCGAYLGWTSPPTPDPAPRPTHPGPVSRSPDPVPVAVRAPTASPPARSPTRPVPPSPTTSVVHSEPVDDALARVAVSHRLAVEHGRPDLAERLVAARTRLIEPAAPVVAVGEFKRGKSTLVNALLRRSVCPVDADIVTAVPTMIRYGDPAGATAYYRQESPDPDLPSPPLRERALSIQDLQGAVSELDRDAGPRPTSVEVRLPHPLLRSGLCLVDTPGVGGLDSAHGLITLGALDEAQAVLFVTDAAQEFTAPEMKFLQMVVQRCPVVACVVTKTDLYPHWREIIALDQAHLARAGLDLEVLGVSSFLRLRPEQDAALTEESGFRPIIRFLATVVAGGAERAARAAAADVAFVAAQLGRQVAAERQVVTRPQETEQVVQTLTTARARTERLASPSAGWQQVLNDRVQDLVTDVDHELQRRLRSVAKDVEEVIDRGDPKDDWPDVEAWLRREVAAEAVATYDTMRTRAEAVVAEVASQFDLEAGAPLEFDLTAPVAHADDVEFGDLGPLGPGGRLGTAMTAVRSGAFVPMAMFAAAGHLPIAVAGVSGALLLAPISLVIFTAIVVTVVKGERARQLAHRRQLAKAAARRYLEEISFRVGKDCRDALRRLQRRLRDEFQDRAAAMHRSSVATLAAAQRAVGLTAEERTDRSRSLAQRATELRRLQSGSPLPRAAVDDRVVARG
jgi:GTPase SAR1 family protein